MRVSRGELRARALLLAIGAVSIACSSSSDDSDPVSDGGTIDAPAEAPTTNCSTPPTPNSPCSPSQVGLECDVGSLSCWKKLTCESDHYWHVSCGNFFPDGGPCC